MTTHTALLSRPTTARPHARTIAPVLIQVPVVSATTRQSRSARPTAPRGRRRIRREIRVAASTLLFALPMSWALMAFVKIGPELPSRPESPRPAATTAVAASLEPIEEGPRVTISLEPAAMATPAEPNLPLARPAGYLVPDLGSEESAHAGN